MNFGPDDTEVRWIGETPFLFRNGKQLGIAWGVRRTSVEAEPPALAPEPTPEPRKAGSRKGVKQKVKRDNTVYARYDWNVILEMHLAGRDVLAISKELGCQTATIYHALEQKGIKVERQRGAPRKDECKAGHNLDEHGRSMERGGRYCVMCRRETSARNHQERKARAAREG